MTVYRKRLIIYFIFFKFSLESLHFLKSSPIGKLITNFEFNTTQWIQMNITSISERHFWKFIYLFKVLRVSKGIIMCWPKNNAQHENCELRFICGQNEDCSPGDSTSDSAEKLLQRDRGEGQYIDDFGEGEIHAIMHIYFFCRSFLLVSWRFLLVSWRFLQVIRSSRHHEGFQCFSRFEEIQELGS